MDRVSTGDTTADLEARRERLRERARARRHGHHARREGERFRTPEWLDRSFVLPLTRPPMSMLPSQPAPHHDDCTSTTARPHLRPVAPVPTPAGGAYVAPPVFVRPPSREIDFARVVRRADARRASSRTGLTATALGAVLLMAYLLTAATGALAASIMFGVVALVALVVRLRLGMAPIPHLERPHLQRPDLER